MNRRLLVLAVAVGLWATQAAAQMPSGSYAQSCRDIRFDGYTLSALCNAMQGPPQRTTIRADQCPAGIFNSNGQLVCERAPQGGGGQRYGRGEPGYGGGPPPYDRGERGYRGGYEEPRGGYGPPPYREERGYGGQPGGYPPGGYPPGGYDRPPQGYVPPPAAGYGPPPGQPPAPPPQQARPAPPPGGGLPPGSWAGSCSNAQMQGATLVASCKNIQGASVQTSIDVRTCKTIANQNGRLVCG
jgi:hypothetical protein